MKDLLNLQLLQLLLSGGTFLGIVVGLIRVGRALESIERNTSEIAKLWTAHERIIQRLFEMNRDQGR